MLTPEDRDVINTDLLVRALEYALSGAQETKTLYPRTIEEINEGKE